MQKLILDKKAFEMSFAWIFAIIAGGVILFLAIYATVQFIGVAKYGQYTEAAKSITILLDPLETGIASAVGEKIKFDKETKVYSFCYTPTSVNFFGKHAISFSEKSGIGQKWAEPGGEITIRNKFIFADNVEQGKELYLFSKPFEMGFKVSDIITISSKKYCFIAPPVLIEEEIMQLNPENINITNIIEECSNNDLKVCFDSSLNCDIAVYGKENNYDAGYIEKQDKKLFYTGSLIYGAIFSSPENYECNIKRLGAKISALAEVYNDKIEIVGIKGCSSTISPYLSILSLLGESIESSAALAEIYPVAKQMDKIEKEAICRIYV